MPRSAFALSAGEGEVFDVGPLRIVTRISGDVSENAFELYDLTLGPATVDYHVHRTMDETLCVIEGEVEFNLAGKLFRRTAGSVAFVPRGVHHGFTNHGPQRARVLVTFTPARSQDEYFQALEKLFAAASLDKAALAALQQRYDQELIVPELCGV